MENILNNKNFIKASIAFLVLMSLLVLAKFINEVKSSDYVGRGIQPPNVITVSGKGEVMAVSDIATLYVTLTKDGATSKAAQSALNDQVTKVLAYLKTKNIADKDVKSEYGGLSPKYGPATVINCLMYPCPQPETKIVGYTATQSITVKIRDVDTANDVRSGLTPLGVNNISGPDFSIDDQDAYVAQAQSKAIDDARAKAEKLAKDLHVSLGKVVNFSDSGSGYPMMYAKAGAMMDSMASSAPAPALPKGENKVTANVTISYEIR